MAVVNQSVRHKRKLMMVKSEHQTITITIFIILATNNYHCGLYFL